MPRGGADAERDGTGAGRDGPLHPAHLHSRPMPADSRRSLEDLRAVWGDGPLFAETGDVVYERDGVTIVCGYEEGSTSERFFIVKQPPFVEAYLELCALHRGATIVELGIAEGGSTALLALAARPEKLISLELDPDPLAHLARFIADHDLEAVVRPIYGIDQADRDGVARAVEGELGGDPIDLVIDDASHLLAETRTSFETLFPRLRPGGTYIIEDWRNDQVMRDTVAEAIQNGGEEERRAFAAGIADAMRTGTSPSRPTPLTDLAVELLLCAGSWSSGAIETVAFTPFWIAVTRGPDAIDPATFRVRSLFRDHFGYLS